MKTVAEAWTNFEKSVIPEDICPIRRSEIHSAFYAGACEMLMMLARGAPVKELRDELLVHANTQRGIG